jgi:uncharacterized membrane protein YebE (DUF533 family)
MEEPTMNFDKLLSRVLDSPLAGGAAGGLLSGGLVTALGNKQARKALGSAAKLGGVAAIGALAYAALQRYQAQQAAATAAPVTAPSPSPSGLQREAAMLVQAMISAARADGTLDETERGRIGARLREFGLAPADFDAVMREWDAPSDPHRIASLAQSEAEAAEVYAASLLAIETDHWAEQAYLRELKTALGLPAELTGMLEEDVRREAVDPAA